MQGLSDPEGRAGGLAPAESASEFGPDRLARQLAGEFGSPVGLLDAATGTWRARFGLTDPELPAVNVETRLLLSQTLERGRVAVLEPTSRDSVVWLWLPLAAEWAAVVAGVAFAASPDTPPPAGGAWGPVCPLPALRAWGQSVADRLRHAGELRHDARAAHPRAVSEGGEGVILARMIRRFRISDPSERFQQLACNALRAALGLEVVAWVPCSRTEPVVSSGEAGRLRGEQLRTLVPGSDSEPVIVVNEPPDPAASEPRRMIAVAADSQTSSGWLIALNPLEARPFSAADTELFQPVASLLSTQQANAQVYLDLKELLFGIIRALTAAIDAKDPYTSGHSERVARIAVRLAEELGMPPSQRSDLYLMGLLHDVGKIGIDDAVLKKAGPLTPEEYRQIQRHVEIGVQILADLKKLNHLLPGVRYHHESLDGTGYPCGLAGDAIPWEARILAVADSYDAMSSTRPYRRRLTPGQIDEILQKGSGVQWDPRVLDALLACRADLELIRQKGLGESLQVAVTGALGRT